MIQFGSALKKAREEAGITLEEIYEKTRISLKHLRAIEAGDFPSVPQTYIRAFIREYARYVGLDEEKILEAYNDHAAREHGVPQPPPPIDSSNLLPQVDESIEILKPGQVQPKHVEVQGKAEVESSGEFVPPVRRSVFVSDELHETIDIRTTPSPPAGVKQPVEPDTEPADTDHDAEGKSATPDDRKKQAFDELFDKMIAPGAGATVPTEKRPSDRKRKSVYDLKPPIPSEEPKAPPPPIAAEGIRKSPVKNAPEQDPDIAEQRRILIIGSIIVVIIAVAIYALYFLGNQESEPVMSMLDSASIRQSLEAGMRADSTQQAVAELPVIEQRDTAKPVVKDKPADEPRRMTAREDSLLLEAVTTAPVWFSIRMDTTRTERGTLGSNDHRVWKAKDRFVITLGDAGAVTFFLNGKTIGTLGEDGVVVKNITLSRQNLPANN